MPKLRASPLASALLAAVFACTGCAGDPSKAINKDAPAGTGLSVQSLKMADGSTKRCSVFVPYAYDAKKRWPTIVFLQGLGEGGNDGVKNTTVGLGPAIRKRAVSFGYIAIFPQSGGRWSTTEAHQIAIGSLDAVAAKYSVDPSRVYLTGLSTGGYGAWEIGARYNDRFAAVVPLCGYSGEAYAKQLVGMPVWAFHNGGDPFVFSSSTRATVDKINKLGGKAKQTIYGALGHNCWDQTYADPKLWEWLAAQRKSGPQMNADERR